MSAFEELRKMQEPKSSASAFDALRNLEPVTATEVPKPIPFEGPQPIAPPISGHNLPGVGVEPVSAPPRPKTAFEHGYWTVAAEEADEALKTIGKGLSEIQKGQAATGASNVAMGALQGLMFPVTPFIRDIQYIGNKIGPELGDRFAVALPIKTTTAKIKSTVQPSQIAVKQIVDNVGIENLPGFIQTLRRNERLAPIDANDNLLKIGQKLVQTEGPHQKEMDKFIRTRREEQAQVLGQSLDTNLGTSVNASERFEQLKERARETGRKNINPIVQGSKPTDIAEVLKHIDNEIGSDPVGKQTLRQVLAGQDITGPGLSEYQRQLFKIRQDLNGEFKGTLRDIKGEQGLHEKQIALRAEAAAMEKSSDPLTRRDGKRLMDIRNKIVDVIDKGAPGYKAALAKYSDDITMQEYFEKGFNLFGRKGGLENHPDFKIADIEKIKKTNPEAYEAMKEGNRIAFISAKKSKQIAGDEINQDLIRALHGDKEGGRLIQDFQDEMNMARTYNKLYEGSDTAARLKANSAVKERTTAQDDKLNMSVLVPPAVEAAAMFATGGQSMGAAAASVIALNAAKKYIKNPLQDKYTDRQNKMMARALMATGPEKEALIQALDVYLANNQPSKTLQMIKRMALPVTPP
jgi:hypothetical protein